MLAREVLLPAPKGPSHMNGTLPLEKTDHLRHRILRRNRDQHMHMIPQQMPLNDLALLLPGKLVEHATQFSA